MTRERQSLESELGALKQKWLATGSFADEQAYLAARVRSETVRFVYLDPDGTLHEWLALVVRHETGVVYGTQCAGIATEQRLVEGYLCVLGGQGYDVDSSSIEIAALGDIFHEGDSCKWGWKGRDLPSEQLARLSRLVENIPYWHCSLAGLDEKLQLRLDVSRIEEIAEAWIPVETPDGLGVLLYENCD